MEYGFVYEWINLVNSVKYIGSHAGHPDDGYIGSGLLFSRAVKKYGIENFKRTILYEGENFRAEEERFLKLVDAANSDEYYNLKNQALGGTFIGEANGMFGRKMSEKSKKQISETLKRKYKEGTKKSNSEKMRGENNPMFGKTDHCQNLVAKSKANAGKSFEEIHGEERGLELRQKLSKAQTGKKHNLKHVKCPHCLTEGSGPNMTRYHFDKCKLRILE